MALVEHLKAMNLVPMPSVLGKATWSLSHCFFIDCLVGRQAQYIAVNEIYTPSTGLRGTHTHARFSLGRYPQPHKYLHCMQKLLRIQALRLRGRQIQRVPIKYYLYNEQTTFLGFLHPKLACALLVASIAIK